MLIADLGLTIIPATSLYKSQIADANISVAESITEGRNEIVLDLFQGDGVYSRDFGTIFKWATGGSAGSTQITIPGTAMPWNPLDGGNPYYVTVPGTPGIQIPCTPGQVITLSYRSGTSSTGPVPPYPLTNGLGQGVGTTGGVHPWPSDRLPGGFSTGSQGECCGAFIDVSGVVLLTVRIDNGVTLVPAPAGTVALSIGVNDNHSFADNLGSWNYAYAFGNTIPTSLRRTVLYVWQPTLLEQPETIYDRASDWDEGGYFGDKFIQGVTIEANSFNLAKTFFLQDSDTLALHALNECPFTFNKQVTRSFSCVTPFIAHSCRVISSDGVAWQVFQSKLVFQPFPPSCLNWETEMTSLALTGYGHVREMNIAHISTADLTLVLKFDAWPTITITIPNSGGLQAKTKVTLPPNKFKLIGLRIFSSAVFRLFEQDIEMKTKDWGSQGPYTPLKPFGGKSNMGATV